MQKEQLFDKMGDKAASELLDDIVAFKTATEDYERLQKEFDRMHGFLPKVIAEKKKAILAAAKEYELQEIQLPDFTCEIKPRKTTAINPGKLWGFAVKKKMADRYWEMVKPLVGKVKAFFGEDMLKDAGVLTEEVDQYNSIKIT